MSRELKRVPVTPQSLLASPSVERALNAGTYAGKTSWARRAEHFPREVLPVSLACFKLIGTILRHRKVKLGGRFAMNA
jgi:hypothetical protein